MGSKGRPSSFEDFPQKKILGLEICTRMNDPTPAENFPETRWSMVLQAGVEDSDARLGALDKLCRTYWPAIYGFARYRGHSPADAEDLTQGFFSVLLKRDGFEKLKPESGKLRSWLIRGFENYRIDQHRRETAQHRGGDWIQLEITDVKGEEWWNNISIYHLSDLSDPEKAFDQMWAAHILLEAKKQAEKSYFDSGNGDLYEALKPALDFDNQQDFARKAEENLKKTAAAIRKSIQRLRVAYGKQIRKQIADTLSDPAGVDDEFSALREGLM